MRCLFSLILASLAWSQSLTLTGPANAVPGHPISLALSLDAGGKSVSAVQTDIAWPSGYTATPVSLVMGKSLDCLPDASRCLLTGGAEPIVSGAVARFDAVVPTSAAGTHPFPLSGLLGSTPDGQAVGIAAGPPYSLQFGGPPYDPTNLQIIVSEVSASMAMTYFGDVDASGNPLHSDSDNSGGAYAIWNGTLVLTCPGSGTQDVKEISALVHIGSGTPNIRLAIYSADGSTRIYQTPAEQAVTGASDSWQGQIGSSLMQLTGGTAYKLVVATDGDVATGGAFSSGNPGQYKGVDYTGGFPASLPSPDSSGYNWPVRVGVEAAAGGGLSIPVAMAAYRQE